MKTNISKFDFFERNKLSLQGIRRIFCGFSGGADSTALLLLLWKIREKYNFKIKAVHFQHGLRGEESRMDACYCAKFCEIRNIDFMEIALNVRNTMKGNESFEGAARKLRLEKWTALAEGKDSAIALGHNSDDRNENMIIRLLRGSNVSGLSSLREFQKLDSITIIRPLLNYSRIEIENFLLGEGISDWRVDSTNQDNSILRNYIRNVSISAFTNICEGAKDGMRRAAMALEDDALFIESETEKIWDTLDPHNSVPKSLPLSVFKNLPSAIKVRILRKWISATLGRDYVPGHELVSRVEIASAKIFSLKDKNAIKVPLANLSAVFIEITPSEIRFAKIAKNTISMKWDWQTKSKIKWGGWQIKAEIVRIGTRDDSFRTADEFSAFFDLSKMPKTLLISSLSEGERMIPFGGKKEVKLKKLFEDKKISSAEKSGYPVFRLFDKMTIIWVGGIRRSNFAPAKQGKEVLMINIGGVNI